MALWLIVGAALSALAALLHIGCIVFGAPWYRFFGAGEHMAQLAESGSRFPALVTGAVAFVLMLWSVIALSGAGVLPAVPLLKPALLVICGVYLGRGLVGFFFMPSAAFGNSAAFWLWSSLACVIIGGVHLIGLMQMSPSL